jgi:hypothetical protein
MNTPMFLQSEGYTRLLTALGFLLAALVIFGAGIFVGYSKAEFSYHWSNNYYRDFGGPESPFGLPGSDDGAPNSYGAFGTVVGVNLPLFAVKGPNEAEKVVIISPQTTIHLLRDPATTTDIHPGESVIVIGEPDDQGQIEASFVRILPLPPSSAPATSAPMTQ